MRKTKKKIKIRNTHSEKRKSGKRGKKIFFEKLTPFSWTSWKKLSCKVFELKEMIHIQNYDKKISYITALTSDNLYNKETIEKTAIALVSMKMILRLFESSYSLAPQTNLFLVIQKKIINSFRLRHDSIS